MPQCWSYGEVIGGRILKSDATFNCAVDWMIFCLQKFKVDADFTVVTWCNWLHLRFLVTVL